MRDYKLYENQDASISSTSIVHEIDCGQDMRWLLQIEKVGTDGTPNLYVEESILGDIWTPIPNYCNDEGDFFALDDSPYAIRDSYFMGRFLRLRIEPNDNTTGTINVNFGEKTKSN